MARNEAGGVARVRAAGEQRAENGGGVVRGAGEQRGRVESVRERDEAVPREEAGGGLEAHEAAVRRRVARRAARIGSQCTVRVNSRM